MLHKSEKQRDLYITQMLKNITCDEVAFDIDNKPTIPNWETTYTLLLVELAEAEEALKINKHYLQEFFTLIRMKADEEEMTKHMDLIAFTAFDVMKEAMHIRAVTMRAVKQLEKQKAPTDGNQ